MYSQIPQTDQGWAWMVALACFTINFIMAGLARTAGVLYVALIDLYGVSREAATTPFSIRVCVRNTLGPVVGLLGQRYGIRPITTIGGIIAGVGGILCFAAPDIFWITIFWGVIHGLGFSLSTVLHMIVINQYFDKYRATALGIGFSGDCFGTFAFPDIIATLLYHYDVKGTFLILGAVVLNIIPAALLLRPPPWLKTNEVAKIDSEYKNKAFVDSTRSLNREERISDACKLDKITEHQLMDSQTEFNEGYENDVEANNRKNSFMSGVPNSVVQDNDSCHQRVRKDSWRQSSELVPYCVPEGVISLRNSSEVIHLAGSRKSTYTGQGTGSSNELTNNIRPRSVSNYESAVIQQRSLDTRQNSLPRGHDYARKENPLNNQLNVFREEGALKNIDYTRKLSNPIILKACELEELREVEEFHKQVEAEVENPLPEKEQSMASLFFRTNIKPIFVLISASMGAYVFLFIAVLTVIIDYAADHGIPAEHGKYLIIGFSVADLFGRLTFGQIVDRKLLSMKVYALMTLSLMGILVSAIPLYSSFMYMITCISCYGFIQGGTAIMFPILVGHYMEKNEEAIGMGCLNFYGGLLMLPMAPMIGYFRDTIGSYDGMFYIVGGFCIFVGLFWQLEPVILKHEKKQKEMNSC